VGAELGTTETVLSLDRVTKLFGTTRAVDEVSLSIRRGEVFTLLGPSGCGKTTTLRLVAGLEHPDEGEIILRDRVVASARRRLFLPPNRRNLGMVFQSYAVWPHMTVFENVAYPLQLRRVSRAVIRDKVARVLDLVGLGGLSERPGTLLSGGQMQRLALCRALVYEPDLLLLDEPFSNGGRIEQVGPPRCLYEKPASAFVRDFLGQTVILQGRVGPASGEALRVAVELNGSMSGRILSGRLAASVALETGAVAHLSIRPEDIEVSPLGSPSQQANQLPGIIDTLSFVGDRYEARVSLGEHRVVLFLPRAREWREGEQLQLGFPPEMVSVWPA